MIEEEIPLLDISCSIKSEEYKKYFEAFKQFDKDDTNHVSNRVNPYKINDFTYF